jgi:dCMP deaminase
MTQDQNKWHQRFLKLASAVGAWSKDPSTRVGCVLVRDKRVVSVGYNGFPRGISDDLNRLLDREQKYEITVHAEVNSVTTAALHGLSTEGSVLINAGIKEVYELGGKEVPERWLDNFLLASRLLAEAGVLYQVLEPTPQE